MAWKILAAMVVVPWGLGVGVLLARLVFGGGNMGASDHGRGRGCLLSHDVRHPARCDCDHHVIALGWRLGW